MEQKKSNDIYGEISQFFAYYVILNLKIHYRRETIRGNPKVKKKKERKKHQEKQLINFLHLLISMWLKT